MLASTARADVPVSPGPQVGAELHLEDALALARLRNFELRSAADDSLIAMAGIRVARQHPNPSLSAGSSRIHADGGDGTEAGNSVWFRSYDSVLQFGQEIELGGERWARRKAAAASADEARARLADAHRTVEADVVAAYAAAALADANQRIARESAGYLREEARIAEVRLSAGDISRSDLDQIELAAARLDLDARNAASAALEQRLVLETLLGITRPDGGIVVADSLEGLVNRMALPGAAAPSGSRPDVAAAEAELRRADADWHLERARRIPDPTLFFSLEHQPPDRPNTLGLGISLPLPLWNWNGGAIAAARATRDQAERAATHVRAEVIADAAAARAAYDEAAARWQRYRDELRPRSDEVRRSVSLAYEKGGASLLDLLAAQRGDNDIRLATMQAANDAVIAAARLRAATTTSTLEESRP